MRPLPLLAAGATAVAAFVVLAALVMLTMAPPAALTSVSPAAAGPGRSCGRVADPDFPIRTELRGGPGAYRAGGAAGEWSLDLTNTTGAECRHLHPVVILYDRERVLDVSHVKLEMADDQGRMRVLPLERTDQDEIVAVPDDRSPGFTVPPHRTVTVRARLAFAVTARPNEISATAATVQRRGDGGDWVGASNTYRFAVAAPGGQGRARDTGRATASAPVASASSSFAPVAASPNTSASASNGAPDLATAGTAETAETTQTTATTGTAGTTGTRGDLLGRVVAALALLTAGAVLLLGVRRLRDHRP
ncbi:hypothetical protein ACIBJC_18550 [Streptomyces sp. NPDC050509]|uniref:hypothetical protein n=1 Tax=Streptomyces sp. NPDC050509 TaxID=3365620 RepID=UPI00379D9419